MLIRTGLAAACVFTVAATAAQAQDNCVALKQLAHIDMEQTKDGRWLVPVKLNGTAKKMLLDTSVVPSAVFSDYATETNLALTDALPTTPPPGAAPAGGRGRGAAPAAAPGSGAPAAKVAKVDSFALGTIAANGGYFKVADDTRKDRALDSNIIGVLGTDMLSKQDFDLDFGGKTLKLFSSDHCPGKVIYWSGPTVAVTFYVDAKDHIRFPVLVNGDEMSAAINTASAQNEMSMVYGKRKIGFDVTDASFQKIVGTDGNPDQYSHRFQSVDLGGLAINNPLIMVVDDSKTNKIVLNPSAGMHSLTMDYNTPDLTLGMAFMNKFHIYVASKELKMYVTPAVSAPAAAP